MYRNSVDFCWFSSMLFKVKTQPGVESAVWVKVFVMVIKQSDDSWLMWFITTTTYRRSSDVDFIFNLAVWFFSEVVDDSIVFVVFAERDSIQNILFLYVSFAIVLRFVIDFFTKSNCETFRRVTRHQFAVEDADSTEVFSYKIEYTIKKHQYLILKNKIINKNIIFNI